MNPASDEFAIVLCMLAVLAGWLTALLKFIFSPLSIPPLAALAREREQNVLAGILLIFFGGLIGIVVVYSVLLGAFAQYLRSIRPGSDQPAPMRGGLPVFPRIALQELMGMVFGIAAYPILVFGTDFDAGKVHSVVLMMLLGALFYPLCALGAYNRVNARRVPVSAARTVYIALFPLMLFVCVFQPLVLGIMQMNGVNSAPYVQLALGAVVVSLETIASARAARSVRNILPP